MSKAFLDFTTQCGIERQHTVRAWPQQNGVADRANRVLSERLTTMLDELNVSPQCWMNLGLLRHSGVNVLELSCMCGTDALLMLSRRPPLMNSGMDGSLMSPTFEFGAALPMCTYRRTRELDLAHTWRNVYSLATLRDIRAGSSIIQLRRRQ